MENPAQQAIENTHLHYIFIIACARDRDYEGAKDAADNANPDGTSQASFFHFPTLPRDASATFYYSRRAAEPRPTATTPKP